MSAKDSRLHNTMAIEDRMTFGDEQTRAFASGHEQSRMGGTNEPEIRFLEVSFQRLTVGPDEVLVIQHPGHLSGLALRNLQEITERAFGKCHIVLLEEGMKIGAVKLEGQDDTGTRARGLSDREC